MNFENFVRLYYTIANKRLREYQFYNGSRLSFNAPAYDTLDVVKEFTHEIPNFCEFLEPYEFNIDIPILFILEWTDYNLKTKPDLFPVLLGNDLIEKSYRLCLGEDDEQANLFINNLINFGIDKLVKDGVISNGNEIR